MKFPTENDPVGDPSQDKDNELDELQRMVLENEKALKRANRMITDLRKKLSPPKSRTPSLKTRKK